MVKYILSIGKDKTPAAVEIGLSKNAFNNDSEVGGLAIQKFHQTYPEVSLHWLITGEGEIIAQNFGQTQKPEETPLEARVSLLEVTLSGLLRDLKSSGNGK